MLLLLLSKGRRDSRRSSAQLGAQLGERGEAKYKLWGGESSDDLRTKTLCVLYTVVVQGFYRLGAEMEEEEEEEKRVSRCACAWQPGQGHLAFLLSIFGPKLLLLLFFSSSSSFSFAGALLPGVRPSITDAVCLFFLLPLHTVSSIFSLPPILMYKFSSELSSSLLFFFFLISSSSSTSC